MPTRDSNAYLHPSIQVQQDFEAIVYQMMMSDTLCETIPTLSLTDKYFLQTFTDTENNKKYCVLTTTSISYPWGTVIVNQDPYTTQKHLSIDCPHPLNDANTGQQAIALFKGTDAKSFILSGSHRHANQNIQPCQDGYNIADAAHTQNCFLFAVKAVMEFWETTTQDYTAIQLHGMGSSSCNGVDGYFTHGTSNIHPQTNEKVHIFRHEAAATMPHAIFTLPGDSPTCNLSGGTNVQGRLINGVPLPKVCNTPATGYSARFIHLEQKWHYRQPANYANWVAALNNAYARFPSATPPQQLILTTPNGGQTLGKGTQIDLTWTSQSLSQTEPLDLAVGKLHADGSFTYTRGVSSSVNAGTGFFTWRIFTGSLPEGDDYVLRVRKIANKKILDYSDSTFRIVDSFAWIFPNGGETLAKGQTYTITWDVRAAGTNTVKLSLHQGSGRSFKRTIANTVPNTGSFDWTVPTSLSDASDYVVRIRNTEYISSLDYSDNFFTIAPL